jgi:hypothetical protein
MKVLVSEDLKITSSDDQIGRAFCRMDVQEGACARIDYGSAHMVVVTDQIYVRNRVGMINSDGGWAELAVVATLWWLCEAATIHQAEKGPEQNHAIIVNRREQHGTGQATEQSQTTEMIGVQLLTQHLERDRVQDHRT